MSNIRVVIMMLVLTVLMAGCGTKQTQEAKPTAVPLLGIVDMDAAVKGHPKYKDLLALQQQGNVMVGQLEAEQLAGTDQRLKQQNIQLGDSAQIELDEMHKAFQQEYNVKLADKEREMDGKMASKAEAINRTLVEEMKAYDAQLEEEYKPLIFNLQLKLKIVQLGKEETAALQAELEKLQTDRLEAMKLKQEQLTKRMNELMDVQRSPLEKEIVAYKKTLDDEFADRINKKQAEIFKRGTEEQMPSVATGQMTEKIPEQLAMKQQEIDALQGFILDNVIKKTAEVAVQGGFEIVLAHVVVNVNAVDITKQVIMECNK